MAFLATLAGVKLLLHLATHHRYGYERDELYFIACAKRLAWGYVDHPPLVPWITRLAGEVFDYSLLGLRLFPILALTGALILTAAMARRLGGGPWAQGLAALSFLIAPLYLRLGTFLNIPSFEVFFWTLLSWLLTVLLREDRPRLWLWIGAVAGLGLLNKHSMLLFGFALAVGLLLTPARAYLRSRWLWLGGAVAGIVFSPNLVWQWEHGFPTLEFVRNLNRDVMGQVSATDFLLGQVLYMHPLLVPVWLSGLAWYLFAAAGRPFRLLGWIFVVTVTVLLLTRSKVYYLAPAFPMLMAAGAVAIEQWLARRHRRWPRAAIPGLLAAGGLVFLPLALPILPIETLDRAIPRVTFGLVEDPFELTEHFHKELGWENQAATVARVYHSLPEADRARAAILAGNYGEAGAIDFFGPELGLPPAISGHYSYYVWGPGEASGEVLIAFGVPRDVLAEIFGRIEEVARIHHPQALPVENDLPVLLCTQPRMPLADAWPRLRFFARIN
ncbi:MAG: glycosyltransferase family 39 protein [bacterium]|nr:glycosyltransferase family 39 protein [bacterium]